MQTEVFKRRATLLICPSSVQDGSFMDKTCSRGSTNIGKGYFQVQIVATIEIQENVLLRKCSKCFESKS